MYLAILSEKKKKIFLELAYNLAHVDGEYCEEEQDMIKAYCDEMHISMEKCNLGRNLDSIIEELMHECKEYEKKVMIFEAIGLAMIDNRYDNREKDLINLIMEKFDIAFGYGEKCENLIEEYLDLQKRMNDIVLSDL